MNPWIRSYPEVMDIGNKYYRAGQFSDAAVEYERAAYVAPTIQYETFSLNCAWVSQMKALGQTSELECIQ